MIVIISSFRDSLYLSISSSKSEVRVNADKQRLARCHANVTLFILLTVCEGLFNGSIVDFARLFLSFNLCFDIGGELLDIVELDCA